jgi:hypothetical protein
MKSNHVENKHFYVNERGLMVFTEAFHLARGSCCGNGCKHCPYDFNRVAEPLRTKLLSERGIFSTASPNKDYNNS